MFNPNIVNDVDANFDPTPGDMSVRVGMTKNSNDTVGERLKPLSSDMARDTLPALV
jgi:hypothetical protein